MFRPAGAIVENVVADATKIPARWAYQLITLYFVRVGYKAIGPLGLDQGI